MDIHDFDTRAALFDLFADVTALRTSSATFTCQGSGLAGNRETASSALIHDSEGFSGWAGMLMEISDIYARLLRTIGRGEHRGGALRSSQSFNEWGFLDGRSMFARRFGEAIFRVFSEALYGGQAPIQIVAICVAGQLPIFFGATFTTVTASLRVPARDRVRDPGGG